MGPAEGQVVGREANLGRREVHLHSGQVRGTPSGLRAEDKKGSLINFQFENGLYTVPKLLQNGYVAIGKAKVEFHRQENN